MEDETIEEFDILHQKVRNKVQVLVMLQYVKRRDKLNQLKKN